MKRMLLALIGIAATITLAAYAIPSADKAEPFLVLTVTSAVEGQEVTFEGHYANFEYAEDYLFEKIHARTTPFQVRVESEEIFAIFGSLDGKAELKVTLTAMEDGQTMLAGAEAIGKVGVVMRRGSEIMSTGL